MLARTAKITSLLKDVDASLLISWKPSADLPKKKLKCGLGRTQEIVAHVSDDNNRRNRMNSGYQICWYRWYPQK